MPKIIQKNNVSSGTIPLKSELDLGELAINTFDGKLFLKKDDGSVETIVEIGTGGGGVSELEKVTETRDGETYNTGWRLLGEDPGYHVDIGDYAFDITTNNGIGKGGGDGGGASGYSSFATGQNSIASGAVSHAEGSRTVASGNYSSHAEGNNTEATGDYGSHAEGNSTIASGDYGSHAEGYGTLASGELGSHAEGYETEASGEYGSHAEGYETIASGHYSSHAEGYGTEASGQKGSHAEGYRTTASGQYGSHAEGYETIANARGSHAEGYRTIATNPFMHAAGIYNMGNIEGTLHETGIGQDDYNRKNAFEIYDDGRIHAPEQTIALHDNPRSLVTREYADNLGGGGVSELEKVTETEDGEIYSTGWRLFGEDPYAHLTIGRHAIDLSASNFDGESGRTSGAAGYYSHAEGMHTRAMGRAAHAEGDYTTATGAHSHAEGFRSSAVGEASHAEGSENDAFGDHSHAEGYRTMAQNLNMHAAGMWNIGTSTETIHETGIGTNSSNKINAFEIYTDGRIRAPELTPSLQDDLKSLVTVEAAVTSIVTGAEENVSRMVKMTQAAYDAITPEASTFYIIVG